MPRNVTVVFADGQAKVYTDVPDDVTPDQIEAEARRQYPDLQISKIMGEDIVLVELRDAVASRTATMDDLEEIARRYNRTIPEDARRSFQAWLDTARDRPDVPIPENLFTGPVSRTEAVVRGIGEGFLEDTGVLDFIQPFADTVNTGLARGMDVLGLRPRDVAGASGRLLGLSQQDIDAAFTQAGDPQSYVDASINAFSRARSELGDLTAEARRQRPNYTGVGNLGGNIAAIVPATTAAGGSLAFFGRGLPALTSYIPALRAAVPTATSVGNAFTRFGQLFGTGGFGAGARGLSMPASIVARGGAGGAAGAFGGLAIGSDDMLTDAATGAAIPFVGTIARRGVGPIYDWLSGRLGDVRAAEIMRNLIADNAAAITAALREAPANARANTAQFLETVGLMTKELAAATGAVTRSGEGRPLVDVAARRAQGQTQDLLELQGGRSALEAAQNAEAMKQAVRTETDPLLREAMRGANVGRTQIIPAEGEAARLNAMADEITQSGIVPRMRGLESRSREQLDTMFENPEFFTLDGPAARTGEIADQAGRRADEGIVAQLNLRDEAARARAVADDLRAQGFAPIDISGIVGNLRSLAREALPDSDRRRLFSGFADVLQTRAAEQGGVIDGEGLHLAKREMGEFVSRVLGQTDPSAISRGTSMMVGATEKLITDALNEAAGPGSKFSVFNDAFSSGMRNIEQQGVATSLARLGRTDVARGGDRGRFENIVRGEDLDFVPEVLGPGNYDINTALPAQLLPVARRLADEFRTDRRLGELGLDMSSDVASDVAAGVRSDVLDMFEPGRKNWLARTLSRGTGAGTVPGGGAIGDQLARTVSENMYRNAMARLAPALADPAEALRLLPLRSTNAMTAGAFDRLAPMAQGVIGQSAQQLLDPAPRPAAGPAEVFLGFQIGPDGQQYPIYGPAGGR